MKRVLLVVPLFLAFFLVAPSPVAHACSCAQSTPAEAVEHVDVVLRGTVVGTEDPDGTLPLLNSSRRVTHEVAVAEVYKGAAAATTFVSSSADGASCGIEVEAGREYVIFARQTGSELRAGLCDGTKPVSDELVADVEAVTGPGTLVAGPTTPATSSAGTATSGSPRTGPTRREDAGVGPAAGLGAGGALIAAGLAAFWWRRRNHEAAGS